MKLLTEDFVYGGIGWKSTVKNGKLSLQSLRDVIPASSRMYHSCQKLNIHNAGELSWFLQVIKAILFH